MSDGAGGGSGSPCFVKNCFYTLNKGLSGIRAGEGSLLATRFLPCAFQWKMLLHVQSLTLASLGDAVELPGGTQGPLCHPCGLCVLVPCSSALHPGY